MLSEVRLDDGAVGRGQVGFGPLVQSAAAHAIERFGQRLVGDIPFHIDGGIVDEFHHAVDFEIDVIMAGIVVLDEVEGVFLRACRFRQRVHHLLAEVPSGGNGRERFRFGAGQRGFQASQSEHGVFIVRWHMLFLLSLGYGVCPASSS